MTEDQEQDPEQQLDEAEDRRRQREEDQSEEQEATTTERKKAEGEKVETEEAGHERTKAATDRYSPQEVQIPVVEVGERIAESEIEVEDDEPVVEASEKGPSVPNVGLEAPEIERRSVDLTVDEPEVARETIDTDVPVVKIDGPTQVQFKDSSFVTAIPSRPTKDGHRVRVPLYRKSSMPEVRSISEFSTEIKPQIRQLIEAIRTTEKKEEVVELGVEEDEEEEEAEIEPTIKESSPLDEQLEQGIGDIDADELPDPFELIFSGGGEVDSGEPLVIGLNDQDGTHMGALRTLCQRVYREKVGGSPEPVILRDLDELTGGDRAPGEIRWIEAEDKIFSVQLDEDEWDTLLDEHEEAWERIWNRIDQLFAQSFGVLIFNSKVGRVTREQEHLIHTVGLEPRTLSPEDYRNIAQLCWGYVDVSEAPNFNMVFDYGRELSERRLKEAGTVESGVFRDATEEHDGPESNIHLHIKWFIVQYLVKQLRDQEIELETPMDIEEVVQTEVPVGGGPNDETHVADVKSGSEVFEVETLFAEDREGSDPRNKLRESFMKYDGADIDVVHIVLDNLTFHRHLKDIVQLKRNHEKWEDEQGTEIRFETLDLKESELIGLNEAISRLKQIADESGIRSAI